MNETLPDAFARTIAPTYDSRGEPRWNSRLTPPDASFARCVMVPDRIIPVIFVPGVMGSNLRGIGTARGTDWRLDSARTMSPWLFRGAEKRKETLTPATMALDDTGALPQGTRQHPEELKRRGWGEVGAMSYAEGLVWLENALNDFDDPKAGERVGLMSRALGALVGEARLARDEVALSYRYRFPVHACGYNWLASNKDSAAELGRRIDTIVARYRAENKRCEKVIIVTHSMGGLVARHCSEVGGYREKILGIVHGVMPALGAAAVYRRFKAGTEGDFLTAMVLGESAAEMTAVLSSAPGPLQLLPTPEYGNGWLKIRDGQREISLPERGDPYGEIYSVRGKWWSLCDDRLMNPLNHETTEAGRAKRRDRDWEEFADLINKEVKPFHERLKQKYHHCSYVFFGSHAEHKAYGTVTWTGNGGSWMRGVRTADVLGATSLDPTETHGSRAVAAPLNGDGLLHAEHQVFRISEPEEDGDTTVPERSGSSPESHCLGFLRVNVTHEAAFRIPSGEEHQRAGRFTLRSIVAIAQNVAETSLRYE